MTDNAIDSLIRETIDRRELLDGLNRMIISDVRQRARRAWLRRWTRIVGFSIAVPLVALFFFAGVYLYLERQGFDAPAVATMLPAVAAFFYAAHRSMERFSPGEV